MLQHNDMDVLALESQYQQDGELIELLKKASENLSTNAYDEAKNTIEKALKLLGVEGTNPENTSKREEKHA